MRTKLHFLLLQLTLMTLVAVEHRAFAQVKIGANPTTIGAASNLEVEAANGNKTIVNKTTGQMTVQDGTQGAGKVFTSDATGAASWLPAPAPTASNTYPFVSVIGSTAQSFLQSNVGQTQRELLSAGEISDPTNSFSPATGRFTATSAGYYIFYGSVQFDNTGITSPSTPTFTHVALTLSKNFGLPASQKLTQYVATPLSVINSGSVSTMVYLAAGDYVSMTTGAQTNLNSGFYNVVAIGFYGYKFSD
ncbi:complement C1q domain-containing protein [Spirosoma aerophilum]